MERARTEWLSSLGFELAALERDHGIVFVVHRIEVDFRRSGATFRPPRRLNDAAPTLAASGCRPTRTSAAATRFSTRAHVDARLHRCRHAGARRAYRRRSSLAWSPCFERSSGSLLRRSGRAGIGRRPGRAALAARGCRCGRGGRSSSRCSSSSARHATPTRSRTSSGRVAT